MRLTRRIRFVAPLSATLGAAAILLTAVGAASATSHAAPRASDGQPAATIEISSPADIREHLRTARRTGELSATADRIERIASIERTGPNSSEHKAGARPDPIARELTTLDPGDKPTSLRHPVTAGGKIPDLPGSGERAHDASASIEQSEEPVLASDWVAFDGTASSWNPAAPTIAVGPGHVVAAAIDSIDFWNRDGSLTIPGPPIPLSTWFEELLEAMGDELGLDLRVVEPRLHYDAFSSRYILAVNGVDTDFSEYPFILFSISKTSDPTGEWCDYYVAPSYYDDTLHELSMRDFSMAVDDNQLVMAANLNAAEPDGTLRFHSARTMYFAKDLYFASDCVSGDDLEYGHVGLMAAGDAYDYLHAVTNIDDPARIRFIASNRSAGDAVRIWHATTRSDGLPGIVGGYRIDGPRLGYDYTYPPNALQPGSERTVYTGFSEFASAVVRNGRLSAVHTIHCEFEGDPEPRACTGWIEVDVESGEVVKSQPFGSEGKYFSFPAVMLDECDRSLIVFNYSSADEFQSVGFTDPEIPTFYRPPEGAGRGCVDNRPPSSAVWGFSNGIALDPIDQTIWGHAAYVGGSAADCTLNRWETFAFEVEWDRCDLSPGPSPSPTTTPSPGPSVELCPGDVFSNSLEVSIPPAPPRADVIFAFDTTGSMGDVLDAARDNVRTIIADLEAAIPDLALGVIEFRDYPIAPFGAPGDTPYDLLRPLTLDRGSIEAALGTLTPGGGGDSPESYTRVLYESYADPAIGWRPDARRFLVMFGDSVPHDDNLNEGITDPLVSPGSVWCAGSEPDCPLDPGRDGIPGTADDLDLQDTLDEMRFADITLLFVASGELSTPAFVEMMAFYWGQWASWTGAGGTAVVLDDVGTLAPTLRDLISGAGSRIGRLALSTDPASFNDWVTSTPREYTDLVIPPAGRNVTFDYAVRVPLDTVIGRRYDFRLRAIGDGALYGSLDVSVEVPASCSPTGPTPTAVPPPSDGGFAIGAPFAVDREFRHEWVSRGAYSTRSGPMSAVAATGIIVQNLDRRASLDALASFVRQEVPYERDPGAALDIHSIEVPRIGPGGIEIMYLPGLDIPRGTYSALVSVGEGRRVAGIVRTDWTDTGGAGLYRNVTPSHRLVVPLVVRNYYGQTSIISLLNDANGRPVDVEIEFRRTGSSTPAAVYTERGVRDFEGLTYDLNDAVAEFEALGDGFLGSATIRLVDSSGAPLADAQVGAVSHINIETSGLAVSSFEAMPVGADYSAAASTIYAPLWRSRQLGPGGVRLDTGISVVNPNDGDVVVDLTYYSTLDASASQACREMRPRTFSQRIPGFSSHVFYQGPGGDDLPDNCFGSAIIESIGGEVLAIVNDSQDLIALSAAYNGVPIQEAHTSIAVPMWRNHYTPALLTTGIQVMNVGDEVAEVHIDFLSTDGSLIPGCIRDCDVTIQPNESHTWWPPSIASLPKGLIGGIGSALIESTQPIVSIVNDYPVAGGVDAATYNGTPNYGVSGAGWAVFEE